MFSPDGTMVVTACEDAAVRVWDSATGKLLGEPLRHSSVLSASFSPDGSRILAATNGSAHLWDISRLVYPPAPVPRWMRDRARAVAGREFDSAGELHTIPPDRRTAILQTPAPGGDDWSALARWLAEPSNARTLTPRARFTNRQRAEQERDDGSLEAALAYDPLTPLVRLLLAGRLVKTDAEKPPPERDATLLQRAAFLRDYDLQRMPDDAGLWERAVRALLEQKDEERTRRALGKLEKLDKDRAAAVRKELGL
jgi:hypothetical protein